MQDADWCESKAGLVDLAGSPHNLARLDNAFDPFIPRVPLANATVDTLEIF